jgi:hypothetical protein
MVKTFFWDDLYLFKYYPDQIIRGVYLSLTNPMSSPSVMTMLVEVTLVQGRPLQKFCNVDFIGLPFLETLMLIAYLVSAVRSEGLFLGGI